MQALSRLYSLEVRQSVSKYSNCVSLNLPIHREQQLVTKTWPQMFGSNEIVNHIVCDSSLHKKWEQSMHPHTIVAAAIGSYGSVAYFDI